MYEPNSGATPEAAWMMNDPEDGSRLLLEAHAAPDPTGADTLGFSFSLWARRQGGWTEVMNGFNWGYSDAEELVDAAEAYLGYEPDDIERIGVLKEPTPAHCLFEFMKMLMKNDLSFLADLEDRMEDVEESIIDRGKNANSRTMLTFRRKLLRIDTYYQQLVDMASGIAENENGLLSKEESRLFLVAERQAERLLKRSLTLKEYSLQLRELYQTQIDLQQNNTMQFFTVITTLFAPLTLLTSWFGMNFTNMPGLDWRWGYEAIIAVSVIIVVIEIIIFKRKKWL